MDKIKLLTKQPIDLIEAYRKNSLMTDKILDVYVLALDVDKAGFVMNEAVTLSPKKVEYKSLDGKSIFLSDRQPLNVLLSLEAVAALNNWDKSDRDSIIEYCIRVMLLDSERWLSTINLRY